MVTNLEMLDHKIIEGDVSFYGYRGDILLTDKKTGFLNFYTKNKNKPHQKTYQTYRDIYESKADVIFMDNEAIRNLLLGFPLNSETVLVRLRLSSDWFYGFFGLIRRLFGRQVTIQGMYKINIGNQKTKWLILKNHLPTITKNDALATPNSVNDIEKFIAYLNKSSVQYVVLRNYEYLPKLHREHGDVDFLVEDSDFQKVKAFLLQNPGRQSIGVHLVSTPKSKIDQVPYLLPHKAKKIIKNAIAGRCNSRIPNHLDAFQSYAYHCVYNKGVTSGLPSTHEGLPINAILENDYLANLQRLAKAAGIENVEFTMEGLDHYLHSVGWRPHMDTLLKLSEKNIWIKKHFFTDVNRSDNVSFVAIILRKSDMEEKIRQKIISFIHEYGFRVVFDKKLLGEKKARAEESLRGGVWIGHKETHSSEFLPSDFIVVTDLFTLHKNINLFAHRVRLLKKNIRKMLSDEGYSTSIIHSTDNTEEAIEYINTVFPESLDAVVSTASDLKDSNVRVNIGFANRFELLKFDILDKKAILKKQLRIKIVNFVFKQ